MSRRKQDTQKDKKIKKPEKSEKPDEDDDTEFGTDVNVVQEKQLLLGILPVPPMVFSALGWVIRAYVIYHACKAAHWIRGYAIREFGMLIHEFDPWFNFRATVYLRDHGWTKFFHWYDTMSWYPLGRPVGTTIYPGMQIAGVFIWKVMNAFGYDISLNDVCVYMPCWFGVAASLLLGLLTYECSGSANAGAVATLVMGIIPAHIMRSVGGGFDNECVAVAAMCLTFWLWVRSLRTENSWPIAFAAAFAYLYMVAAWGGYVFVINMVGFHAGTLVLTGHYNTNAYRAYTIFYGLGTFLATFVPVVSYTPLKSLEQMAPLALFVAMQLLAIGDTLVEKQKLKGVKAWVLRLKVFAVAGLVLAVIVGILFPMGYFGPLSARVRGLFVKHTRTGNPLVDSVAEHQPANPQAYYQFLHQACYTAPVGFIVTAINWKRWSQSSFLIFYAGICYYFSLRMMRLILLAGPVVSALTGVAVGCSLDWVFNQMFWPAGIGRVKITQVKKANPLMKLKYQAYKTYFDPQLKPVKLFGAAMVVMVILSNRGKWKEFKEHCDMTAQGMSNPSIVFKARLSNGEEVIVDDYVEAYHWLRDNTPEDARVLAWWDYGYQITGIGNRTSVADGNTWNHEHIATLGRALTSPVKQAHRMIKHLADYVLVWAGGGGDDLAKSPHMARIGNSVFLDICPGDPTCAQFGFYDRGHPTPMMAKSLLYNLHSGRIVPGVEVDPERFREVFMSKYGKVRIWKVQHVSKESKEWVMDPKNRICDAPGSWYCVGQYPPALQPIIQKRKNFRQLEDFNTKKDSASEAYTEEYMRRMAGGAPRKESGERKLGSKDTGKEKKKEKKEKKPKRGEWKDTEETTFMKELITSGDYKVLKEWIESDADSVNLRSTDGRGPLWWAYEQGNAKMIKMLKKAGASDTEVDKEGIKPSDLGK